MFFCMLLGKKAKMKKTNGNGKHLKAQQEINMKMIERFIEEDAESKGDDLSSKQMEDRRKALWEEYSQARKKYDDDYSLYCGQVKDFKSQFDFLKKRKKMTNEQLAEITGIHPTSLSNYSIGRNSPSIGALMAICMALELEVEQATELMTSLGICLVSSHKVHYAYLYLLKYKRGKSIKECNDILEYFGITESKYRLGPRSGKK